MTFPYVNEAVEKAYKDRETHNTNPSRCTAFKGNFRYSF